MDGTDDEAGLIRKLIVTGHLNVPERRALPMGRAKASLIRSIFEETLRSGRPLWAWWLPDDSLIGCAIEYIGIGGGDVLWKYSGIEGDRTAVHRHGSLPAAVEALLREAQGFWGDDIDGVPIDWQS